ncbi:hypothetical protein LINPERPRIM_LOCUS9647 [Linum perenne]
MTTFLQVFLLMSADMLSMISTMSQRITAR